MGGSGNWKIIVLVLLLTLKLNKSIINDKPLLGLGNLLGKKQRETGKSPFFLLPPDSEFTQTPSPRALFCIWPAPFWNQSWGSFEMSSWKSLLLRIGEKCPEYGGIGDFKDHIVSFLFFFPKTLAPFSSLLLFFLLPSETLTSYKFRILKSHHLYTHFIMLDIGDVAHCCLVIAGIVFWGCSSRIRALRRWYFMGLSFSLPLFLFSFSITAVSILGNLHRSPKKSNLCQSDSRKLLSIVLLHFDICFKKSWPEWI